MVLGGVGEGFGAVAAEGLREAAGIRLSQPYVIKISVLVGRAGGEHVVHPPSPFVCVGWVAGSAGLLSTSMTVTADSRPAKSVALRV